MEHYTTVSNLCGTLYGDLLLCKRNKDGETFVVKCFNLESICNRRTVRSNQQVYENGLIERDMMTQLQHYGTHQHIVNLHDVSFDDTNMYLFMDHCSNGDLCSYIDQVGHLQPQEAAIKFRQIISAVSYLHRIGFAHRDLSLENILLDANGDCKLCDFGLVAPIRTRVREAVGKRRYMAPEVADPSQLYRPAKADVWSLGIVLFLLLTGHFLFLSPDPDDPRYQFFLDNGLEGLAGSFELDQFLSPEALDLLKQMIQPNPSQRISLKMILRHPFCN